MSLARLPFANLTLRLILCLISLGICLHFAADFLTWQFSQCTAESRNMPLPGPRQLSANAAPFVPTQAATHSPEPARDLSAASFYGSAPSASTVAPPPGLRPAVSQPVSAHANTDATDRSQAGVLDLHAWGATPSPPTLPQHTHPLLERTLTSRPDLYVDRSPVYASRPFAYLRPQPESDVPGLGLGFTPGFSVPLPPRTLDLEPLSFVNLPGHYRLCRRNLSPPESCRVA